MAKSGESGKNKQKKVGKNQWQLFDVSEDR